MGGLLPDELFPIYFYYCGFCITWMYELTAMKLHDNETEYEFLFVFSVMWGLFLPILVMSAINDGLTKVRGK